MENKGGHSKEDIVIKFKKIYGQKNLPSMQT